MHPDFALPSYGGIYGRSSSITAAFVQTLAPVVEPTDDDVREALSILGMSEGNCRCAYCGDPKTEWDHFRPLVLNRMPTGYITEIANLVPSCGKCNQSRGNKNWKDWILSSAKRSPKTRGVAALDSNISRLEAYERWREPIRVDFEKLLGTERWNNYWKKRDHLLLLMMESQAMAVELRAEVTRQLVKQPLHPGALARAGERRR